MRAKINNGKRSYAVGHVLMTTDASSGIWDYSLELAKGLQDHGVSTTLAPVGAAPTVRQTEDARAIASVDLAEGAGKGISPEWLLFLENRLQPDIVHLNDPLQALLPWRTPLLVTVHECPLTRWGALNQGVVPGEIRHRAAQVRDGLQAAGLVVAPSGTMLREMEERHGPLANAACIYTGVNPGEYTSATRKEIVLCNGSLGDEADNLFLLDDIAPRLKWPIFLAGEAKPSQRKNVQLVGSLGRAGLKAWYARAPIYAHPARYEPFGMSVLEAAMCGCALVLSDIAAMHELWHGAAIFVPADDPDAWSHAINDLIADEGKRHHYQIRARQRAESYTAQSMATGYLFAYQELVQSRVLPVADNFSLM